MYNSISKSALKFLNKLSPEQALTLTQKLGQLPMGDVAKLKGKKNLYRLRVGNIRVVFTRTGDRVDIVSIDYRGNIYKG
jgi:mRNA interferase RelE/StbE